MPAWDDKGKCITLKASVAMERYVPVVVTTGEIECGPATAGEPIAGVLQNKCDALEAGRVCIDGISIMIAAGAIAAGDQVVVAADVTQVETGTGTGVIGTALTTATTAGQNVSVLLQRD